jgi:hypothetical protein
VSDAAESARGQKKHLIFEGVGRQRLSVAENYGLSVAPILVVDLGAVFSSDGGHAILSSSELYAIGVGRASHERRVSH